MKKFIVIYYAPQATMEKMHNMSPEETEKNMKPWMEWVNKCGDALIDMGAPLSNGQNISTSSSTPSKKDVTGYSILQAENMDEAKKLLQNHPHLVNEEDCTCEIEIYESMPMPN